MDGSYGSTYFNPETGSEFSILGGATYNFENGDTEYNNGIDGHVDWRWSRFLPSGLQVGAASYVFHS